MENQLTKRAEDFAVGLLKNGLTEHHRYHDLPHTLSVRKAALAMGRAYQMSEEELEMIELAALFHDTGFTKQYDLHEDLSKEIARQFLDENGFPKEKTATVLNLIGATRVGVEPQTLGEKILKDADFNTFDATYEEKSAALQHEWEVFKGIHISEEDWIKNNVAFWESHEFYTGEALALFGDQKRKALKKFKKQMEAKTKKEDKEDKGDLGFSINNSKSAQMMFKTTLRNQIDLTNIADNKANIMLTINSALITVGIPLATRELEASPQLIYPFSILLLTCILSIVSATLATRPGKMSGTTDLRNIEKGTTNLFFFGNFFKMPQSDYKEGLRKVVGSDDLLDKSIVNDLYFLGLSLGRKYSQLRITYSVFMIGMTVTVIVYAITYMMFR